MEKNTSNVKHFMCHLSNHFTFAIQKISLDYIRVIKNEEHNRIKESLSAHSGARDLQVSVNCAVTRMFVCYGVSGVSP